MNLIIFKLEKGLLLFFLVSPAILVLFPRETQGEPGNSVGENEEDSQESVEFYGAKPQAQCEDKFVEILEKLDSYEQFMREMNGVPEKLNKLYTFLPLLQELNKPRLERLERERLEKEGREQERLKGDIMKSPRAKLYTGKNFTGNFETYNFNSASIGKGCHQLQNYPRQIKSIDTEGTCIRLFQQCSCALWSQAFYPGMDGNAIDSKLKGVNCIGPCSPNELEGAEIKGLGSEIAFHKREDGVPDLIADYNTWANKTSLSFSPSSIRAYNLGIGNRLEGVYARIRQKHLRTPVVAEQVRIAGRSFSSARFQLDEDREQVGFAIPLELGGVSDQLYNIFPQAKAAAVKYHQTLFSPIKKYFQKNPNKVAYLDLRFLYEDSSGTKPRGIWYWCYLPNDGPIFGYLFN